MASGIIRRLISARFKVCITEISHPVAVRRGVSYCESTYEGEKEVEGMTAKYISSPDDILPVWKEGKIPLLVDPDARVKDILKPDVLVDAILAKKNLGTNISDAPLVIGLGPGFQAGKDVHLVVETNRGHNLGRVILQGSAEENTGIPGVIAGVSADRVLRAPQAGVFLAGKDIGDHVDAGEVVGTVGGASVQTKIGGIVRGLIRNGLEVHQGIKLGDVDPRDNREYCYTISDKARAVAGGVLEGILSHFNG